MVIYFTTENPLLREFLVRAGATRSNNTVRVKPTGIKAKTTGVKTSRVGKKLHKNGTTRLPLYALWSARLLLLPTT